MVSIRVLGLGTPGKPPRCAGDTVRNHRRGLCFTVGPARNWLNLWKPAIDALDQILGHAPAAGPWSPPDGRIVDLGLHCRVNPSMGNDVLIAIAASHATWSA